MGSRYIPAIDGLRAFSVLAVIFYHMELGWAPGGLMGVTVFFVISGYLINGLLVAEHDRTGAIKLGAFWLRRAKRILPAVVLTVVGTAALCALFNPALLDKMRPDMLPSLLFFNNWWQIFRDVTYGESFGASSPLLHFWSLSIEEQFYLVWPLLLLLMYKIGLGKRAMSVVVLVLALLSGAEMMALYDPLVDPNRLYYGTDTRAMSLLIGVWLAFAWPSPAIGAREDRSVSGAGFRFVCNVLGIVAFAGIVAIVVLTDGYSSFPYYAGIPVTTLLAAALIVVLTIPDLWLSKLFSLAPLVWIGKLSYSMYLWHFPILLLTTDANSTVDVPWWMRLVQLALIVAASALSYYFVENPIRRGEFLKGLRTSRSGERATAAGKRKRVLAGFRVALTSACCAGLVAVACYGVFTVAPIDYDALLSGESTEEESEAILSGAFASESPDSSEGEAGQESLSSGMSYVEYFGAQRYDRQGNPIYEPLLVGDSVAASAVETFYRAYPYGHIDAVVRRHVWENPYEEYSEAGVVGEYVVICLGTNNIVTQLQVDNDLLGAVTDDKKVFMVNVRNTQEWVDLTNSVIAAAPERHPNVTIVDWYSASEGHDEYFVGDGTHLTEEGAQAYIDLIQEAIRATFDE